MDTENGIIDHNAQRQKVEHVGEILPDRGRAVLPGALEVEAICLQSAVKTWIEVSDIRSVGRSLGFLRESTSESESPHFTLA